MQGFVETIHLFRTRPDLVAPLLQRYLNIEDRKAAQELYAFHVPVFQKVLRPSFPGMQALREFLVRNTRRRRRFRRPTSLIHPSLINLHETGS
jgi:hypothetical protein